MTDVVITGGGVVSALGDRIARVHQALCAGQQGFGPSTIAAPEAAHYRVGEIRDFVARNYLGERNLRPLDRTGQLVAVAAELALADSDWPLERRDAENVGLVMGTTFGSARTIGEFDRRAMRDGVEYASPLDFSNTVISAAAGQVAIWHRLRGINSTISSGMASGLQAIGYASQLIRTGRATALLAGGAEEFSFETFLGFARANLLCAPDETPRPFDRRRNGCILGEGAAFLMLESAAAAAARQARVIGRVESFGAAYDRGAAMGAANGGDALRTAIASAMQAGGGVAIGAVMSSASGHASLDACEAIGIRDALAGRADRVPVTTAKGHLGETQGAAGALQTMVMLESLRARSLPPVGGLKQAEEQFRLDFVTGAPRRLDTTRGLVTALSREGNACALVVAVD